MAETMTSPKPGASGKWYKEMIGPLPAGAWFAVIGAGLAFSYYRKRHGTAPATTATTQDTSGLLMTDPSAGNLGLIPTAPPVSGPGLAAFQSNTDWYRAALNYCLAHGFDQAAADQALRDYMAGNALTAQEQAIIDIVLQNVGPLPQPPPPVQHPNPNPTPGGPPSPPNPPSGTPNLQGMSWMDVILNGNHILEHGLGDPKPYADEIIKRIQSGTGPPGGVNDPVWSEVPTFAEYVLRDFWKLVP